MTLILTALTRKYVVQVGDRLVTAAQRVFDSRANKMIIYRSRDAIVTIGYSGLAFCGGRPTDQWIAETISGESQLSGIALCDLCTYNNKDLGLAILDLHKSLHDLASNRSLEWMMPIEICISGWHWKKRLARPTAIILRKSRNSGVINFIKLDRHWLRERSFHVLDTGGWIFNSNENIKLLKTVTMPIFLRGGTSGEMESALCDIIRQISLSTPGIGRDFMSVQIPTPPGDVLVRYLIDGYTKPQIDSNTQEYYSPFIVGREKILGPAATNVGATLCTGGINIKIQVPHDNSGMTRRYFLEGQDRPSYPSRK